MRGRSVRPGPSLILLLLAMVLHVGLSTALDCVHVTPRQVALAAATPPTADRPDLAGPGLDGSGRPGLDLCPLDGPCQHPPAGTLFVPGDTAAGRGWSGQDWVAPPLSAGNVLAYPPDSPAHAALAAEPFSLLATVSSVALLCVDRN